MTVARASRLQPPTPRVALAIAAALMVAGVLYVGREALTPFVVGLLLVYVLAPAVERLAHAGVPRWVAVLLLYLVTAVVLVEATSFLVRPLVDQARQFIEDLPRYGAAVGDQLRRLGELYRGLDLPHEVRAWIDGTVADLGRRAGGFDPGALLPVATSIAAVVGNAVGYLIVPVWGFYILKDRPRLIASFDAALPPSWRADARALVHIVDDVFGRWLRGQLLLGLVVGLLTFAGLLLLGAVIHPVFGQLALLLAVIAGFLELLPFIGPILSAIPAILVGASVSVEAALAALALYVVVQQLENNLLVPKIQGDAVALHPSIVIFALVVGATIAGLLGAILALPLTAIGRDIYRYLFRRLSPEAPAEAPAPAPGVPADIAEAIATSGATEATPPEAAPADEP